MTAEKVTLKINDTEVCVNAGSTILDAAKSIGVDIPTLCHREGLPHFGSCFICVVEVVGRRNLVPSCSTVVTEGIQVRTDTELVRDTRKLCLELLLSDHIGDCIAPCTVKCPASCQIQAFMNCLSRNDNKGAIEIIKESLPIPGALGRICPRPCESQCRRVRVDEPLAIGWLHRFAADCDASGGKIYTPPTKEDSGKKVAIIGAGPAGMSCAYFLRQAGHAVTVYEAENEPGGMLRWGIPAYRLPRDELALELEAIIGMGVEMRYGQRLGTEFSLDLLQAQYDAVFIAIGASLSAQLGIAGESINGVFGGIEFLKRVAQGENIAVGERVVVIGGGNTAIDALRSARRLGAKNVTLLYRRGRAEMPALAIEVDEAEKEGSRFEFLAAPVEIHTCNNQLLLKCQRMELGPAGPDGRRRPLPVSGGEFELAADTVIAAVGQKINSEELKHAGLEAIIANNRIVSDPNTMETELKGVFAGGDAAFSEDKRIAVWAVAAGCQAANSIDRFLNHDSMKANGEFRIAMGESPAEVSPARFAGIEQLQRATMPELELEDRVTSFREVELGFTPTDAKGEAERCLNCGCSAAINCYIRKLALRYNAQPQRWRGASRDYTIDTTVPGLIYESGKCINCSICVRMAHDRKDCQLFGFVNRGFDSRIKSYPGFVNEAARLADKCAEACPTGALTLQENLGKGCSCKCR